MTNRKTTKKALLGSLLALVLCFSMLVGTTFAWFTDNEVLADNKITAGTLDIAVEGDQTLFQADDILWEPGFSAPFEASVENIGSLWLKYALVFDNLEVGDDWGENETADPDQFGYADITEVLDVYVGKTEADIVEDNKLGTVKGLFNNGNMAIGGILAPEDATIDNAEAADGNTYDKTDDVSFVIKMRESAGNEYKGAWAKFDVKVVATQYTAEKDGFDNNMYDEGATLDYVQVNTEAELAAALYDGQNVVVKDDITIDDTMAVFGSPIINLEADLDASNNVARPFNMTNGSSLTINAADNAVVSGNYGLVNIPAETDATVVINGGTYTGDSDAGAFIKVREYANANITLNDVTFTDNNGFIINTVGSDNETTADNVYLTINGGNFTAEKGIQAITTATINDATFNIEGIGFEVSGMANINNCVINTGDLVVNSTPACAVAASYGGKVIVDNCEITAATYALCTLPSSGEIVATDSTINGTNFVYDLYANAKDDYSKITVDGEVVGYKTK